jgi:D-serine deaminase-like pyridoxal phosphate-dependent protein
VLNLHGFYSHADHSYASSTPSAAVESIVLELETVIAGATALGGAANELTLSVGATPTALTAMTECAGVQRMLQRVSESGCRVELHAGVYTTLDLQQVSTNAAKLGLEEIGFTVLAEVVSVYPGRGKDGGDEVLVALGSTQSRQPTLGLRTHHDINQTPILLQD